MSPRSAMSPNPFESCRPEGEDRHAEFELLARIASRYYLEDKTQADIACELGLSRQKIQRLIRQARDQGIVEIHVHAVPVLHLELESKLKEIFHLDEAVVATSHPDESYCRRSVARAAASYLERHLSDGAIVAIGLGRNTSAVANFLDMPRAVYCTFVSAMGGSPDFGASINPNDICSAFASRTGGQAQALYAPAFVENASLRDMLIAQPTIAQTLDIARRATMAVTGIGTPDDDSILVRANCVSLAEVRSLRQHGAVGEILGNYYDVEGRPVHSGLDRRRIALSLHEIRQIGPVMAVAAEPNKSKAILGALRTGAVRVLVTECRNAIAVLRLAGITDLKEEETLLGARHG